MKQYHLLVFVLLIAISLTAGCQPAEIEQTEQMGEPVSQETIVDDFESRLDEIEILEIRLPPPLDKGEAEISGMDWYGDKLVLLPQYPDRFPVDGMGSLFVITRNDLLTYIKAPGNDPIKVEQVKFDDAQVSKQLAGFEGFEAITFSDDHFYVTVETAPGANMLGFVFRGVIEGELEGMTIEGDVNQKIRPQAGYANASEESILIFDDLVYTFFEDYGYHKNNRPVVHVFDLDLVEMGTISMAQIEYRLTDVTQVDKDSRFWGMNYFYPGDIHLLPATDPIAEKYGEGSTHQINDPVERLVQFQITENGVILLDQAPIQFRLLPENEARNWEGVVKFDDIGFLVVTDKFPSTILGFCEILR